MCLLTYLFKIHIKNYIFILFFIFSKVFSPIPSTFFNSSIVLNPPFSSLYIIIELAFTSPIPGISLSLFKSAVLILILPSSISISWISLISMFSLLTESLIFLITISSWLFISFALFILEISASFVNPPAASIKSLIILPSFKLYTSGLMTSPLISTTIIFPTCWLILVLLIIKL